VNRASSSAGFTLVEALVTLALMAGVGLMLLTGMQLLHRREPGRGGGARSVESAQLWLRSRLTRAFPLTSLRTGTPMVDFDGQAETVAFVAPPPDAEAPDAVEHYSLAVSPAGDLQLQMVSDLAIDPEQKRDLKLLSGATTLKLDYFGPAPPDNQPRWRSSWQQQPSLPALVRIRVGFPPGDRRVWPDLIIDPRATLDSQCVIVKATGLCQGRS
jgi:general secretion pathway protein J